MTAQTDSLRISPWRALASRATLVALFLLCSVCSSAISAQSAHAQARSRQSRAWLCWRYSGKGADTIRIDRPRSLAYFTKHLGDFDREIAWRMQNEKSGGWPAIRADIKFVTKYAGQRVLDVFFVIPGKPRPVAKMILVGTAGRFRPLVWILDDAGIQLDGSEVKVVQGVSILSTRCRVSGTGNHSIEDYFVLDPRAPAPINLRPQLEALIDAEQKSAAPKDCNASKGGGFDLGALKYATPLWKATDPNCCPSCGLLEITFQLKDGRILKGETHYDPTRNRQWK